MHGTMHGTFLGAFQPGCRYASMVPFNSISIMPAADTVTAPTAASAARHIASACALCSPSTPARPLLRCFRSQPPTATRHSRSSRSSRSSNMCEVRANASTITCLPQHLPPLGAAQSPTACSAAESRHTYLIYTLGYVCWTAASTSRAEQHTHASAEGGMPGTRRPLAVHPAAWAMQCTIQYAPSSHGKGNAAHGACCARCATPATS
eukprot:COSAG06_NODE_628_length_13649_cov_20.848930_9_plen_207_part_00